MTRTPAQQAQLAEARRYSAAWHRSPEGRAWHSAHTKANWADPRLEKLHCEFCKTEFESPVMAHARFCTEQCAARQRDAEHRSDEEVPCPVCGTVFWQNKYKHQPKTCSRECGWTLRKRNPRPRRVPGVDTGLATADAPSTAALRRGQRLSRTRGDAAPGSNDQRR